MFEPIQTLSNFDFGQLFMWIGANNDQIWPHMTSDEWFWAMFEPIPTLSKCDIGQLFMWIGANNDQIWLPRGLKSDFEFTFGQLVRWIGANNGQILLFRGYKSYFSNVRTDSQLDLIFILVNFSYELRQIMTRYAFLEVRWVILSNVRTDSNLTWFYFWSTFDMNWVK